jgi:hypothetical protein
MNPPPLRYGATGSGFTQTISVRGSTPSFPPLQSAKSTKVHFSSQPPKLSIRLITFAFIRSLSRRLVRHSCGAVGRLRESEAPLFGSASSVSLSAPICVNLRFVRLPLCGFGRDFSLCVFVACRAEGPAKAGPFAVCQSLAVAIPTNSTRSRA